MRVIALHGFDSTGSDLAEQLRPLSSALGWQLTCPDGPVVLPSGRHAWFRAVEPGPTYVGAMQSVAALDALVERTTGRVDAALGFSQGATMLNIWQARSQLPSHRRWRLPIHLAPPFPVRDAALQAPVRDAFSLVAFARDDPCLEHAPGTLAPFEARHRLVVFDGAGHRPPLDAPPALVAAIREGASRRFFAFDMDGVIVDSARECGITAWRGCVGLIAGADGTPPSEAAVADFCRVRPLLEHGFEALVLWWRLQLESVADMLGAGADAAARMVRAREAMGESVDELKARFKAARDAWIASDEPGWFAANGFYAPVVECLGTLVARRAEVYVVTTKSKEFARRLLDKVGLGAIDDAHLFGLSAKTKAEILGDIAHGAQAQLGGGTCVFVEDRVETLHNVAARARCATELVLAGHGYNTESDKRQAVDAGYTLCLTADELAAHILGM